MTITVINTYKLHPMGNCHRAIAAIVASTPSPKNVHTKPRHSVVSNGTGSAKNLSIAAYNENNMVTYAIESHKINV